uniref:Myb-like, SWIRM and MPN domain-containing protein 1 n=1 Tax=Cyprinus carpio TaxID=7962 RepID=A0A8C1RFV7_CYPCA
MADELDVVDIEGDECDERVGDLSSAEILQDQYLQSAWKTNSSILAQFGHRWTKIAKLIGTRSVLQVKSYARQYFKNKSKTDTPAEVSSSNVTSDGTLLSSIQPHVSALTNAVRIEQLSDDEDVDITDDCSDDGLQCENQPEPSGSPETNHKEELSPMPHPLDVLLNPLSESESTAVDGPTDPDADITHIGIDPEPKEESGTCFSESESPGKHSLSEEESTERADKTESDECPEEEVEEDQEEEEELRAPEQEVVLDLNTITDEEKHAIPEFFEGRPSKTPERYLKIRNYILDQWGRSRPKYLNKTSVRPGLKNCGDVNCIGRIHTYLELIGAINFNCDQAIYNRPRLVDRSRLKENKDSLETYHLAQRLQSVRTRKRRIRDMWGNWCDAKDLEGQTYEHLSAEELAIRREEMKKKGPKPSKLPKQRGSFDPFQLIPCKAFGEETEEPFRVIVCAEALIVMDIHAHVSMGEVIGLLGGTYEEEEKVLKICAAEPCNSLSTGLQCEMDPVSQTQASELLGAKGHSVVGWYHSHPAFDPNPSLRDIDTQAKYQSYFSRGGAPFIGMIVSPYNSNNPSPLSQTTCLLVQEETGPSGPQRFPYRFNIQYSSELPDWSEVMRRAEWVVFKYRLSHGSVPMDRLFRRDSSLTCLEKMLTSIQKILEQVSEIDIETFLVQIETLFNAHFLPETGSSSSHLHETVTQPQLLSFISSEPINSSQATNETRVTESDSPDELYTTRPVNHVKSCNEEEDEPVTQAIGKETV